MTDDKAPAEGANAPNSPEAAVPPRRGILRILLRPGLLAGLFVAAVLTSWQYRVHLHDEEEPHVEPVKVPLKKIEPVGNPVELLARGDDALQHHRYALALSHYEELLERDPAATSYVQYRYGLCNESLGQLDKAVAAYRRAISATPTPSLSFASHLGMARCLLRQRDPRAARRLLYPFLFDEARQQTAPTAFVADARYLVALSLSNEAYPASTKAVEEQPLAFSAVELEIPFYLDEIGGAGKSPREMTVEAIAPPLSVQKKTLHKPAIIVRVEQTAQPAWKLLDQLATAGGWRTEWSKEAIHALEERTLHVQLKNWPLRDLLDLAADNFDLVCQADKDLLRFTTLAENTEKPLRSIQREMTQRALLGVIAIDPGHAWTAAAYLELGNGEADRGQLIAAAKWFERVIHEAPVSPCVPLAYYNLAQLRLRKLEFVRAREAFFRVIDYSPGHELALRAYLQIGQIYLEDENAKDAIVHLQRAQTIAPQSRYHPLATLLLSAAHLQNGNPDLARQCLAKNRAPLQKDPFKASAGFLEAYAQYRLAKSAPSNRREASDLLGTLWRDQNDLLLGSVGNLLVAQAYYDLGFWDQTEQRLRKASPQTHGALADSMEYLLGETLLKQNQREQATRLFEKLAAKPSPYRARARFQLAQMDLQEKRFKECAEKCRELWAEHSLAESPALLQLWGAALEATGDLTKAARCFAGKAPE